MPLVAARACATSVGISTDGKCVVTAVSRRSADAEAAGVADITSGTGSAVLIGIET